MFSAARDAVKKAKYAAGFKRRRLVHTNLQLLYDCNFRCTICDFWHRYNRNKGRLTLDQVGVIAAKLAEIGPQIVSVGGGEPLLHEDIVPIVATLAKQHFPVMICNGWFVTPAIARSLFEAGICEVSVSVDYADASRHDALRGTPGAHARALEALRVLHDARVHRWQRVHMISVLMADNLDDIEALIRLCRDMGITYLLTLYSTRRGRADYEGMPSDVSRRLLQLKERYPEFVQIRGYLARFDQAVRDGGVGPCYAGKNLLNVDSSGDVTPCIDRLEEPVGNLLVDDMETIERRLLERHHANRCRSCWTSCRGAIETLMYGDQWLANLRDYHEMTKSVPIATGIGRPIAAAIGRPHDGSRG